MIVLKRYTNKEFVLKSSGWEREVKCYEDGGEHSDFHDLLCGNAGVEEKYPPFRDKESAELIRTCNYSEFVEGEWYAMITEYGKTCLEACCGSVRYALTVIANSRRGIYTELGSAGDNVWRYLAGIEMEILIAYYPKTKYNLPIGIPFILKDYETDGAVQDVLNMHGAEEEDIPDKYKNLKRIRQILWIPTEWYQELDTWEWQFTKKYSLYECLDPMELLQPIAAFDTFRDFQLYLLRKWPIYEPNLLPVEKAEKDPIRVKSYLTHLKDTSASGYAVYILDKLQDDSYSIRHSYLHGNPLFDLYTKAGILHDLPAEVESKESIFLVTDECDYTDVTFGGKITYGEDAQELSLFNGEYIAFEFIYLLSEVLEEKKLQVLTYDCGLPKTKLRPLTAQERRWCDWV